MQAPEQIHHLGRGEGAQSVTACRQDTVPCWLNDKPRGGNGAKAIQQEFRQLRAHLRVSGESLIAECLRIEGIEFSRRCSMFRAKALQKLLFRTDAIRIQVDGRSLDIHSHDGMSSASCAIGYYCQAGRHWFPSELLCVVCDSLPHPFRIDEPSSIHPPTSMNRVEAFQKLCPSASWAITQSPGLVVEQSPQM